MTICSEAEPVIPSSDDFAWTKDESTNLRVPVWMTIPEIAIKDLQVNSLARCSCKGNCKINVDKQIESFHPL